MSVDLIENGGERNQRLDIEKICSKNVVVREEGKLSSSCRGSGIKGFSVS